MSDSSLKTWVSDMLMAITGYSQALLVDYVIRLSKEAKSPSDLLSKLVDYEFPLSPETRLFAHKLFTRVSHKSSGLTDYQKHEREAAEYAKKQSRYMFLDADDENDVNDSDNFTKSSCKKRFRLKCENPASEDDDNEATVFRGNGRNVRRRNSKVDEDEDDFQSEKAMARDQEERMQLEQKMKERDTVRTRQLMEAKLSKKDEEETIRRSKALEENDTSDLRKRSRQVYLQKRTEQKLQEIHDEIIDNEYIFGAIKLSEVEKRALGRKKDIFVLASSQKEELNTNEYKIPESYDQDGGVNQENIFAVGSSCTTLQI